MQLPTWYDYNLFRVINPKTKIDVVENLFYGITIGKI